MVRGTRLSPTTRSSPAAGSILTTCTTLPPRASRSAPYEKGFRYREDAYGFWAHDGRRWRRQDPALPGEVAERLLSHLGRGRSGVRLLKRAGEDPAPHRRRVDLAT